MKRLLYLIHRWAGIAVALFMFIWFTSGLVIMYAGPSALGPAEQLVHREILRPEAGWLSLGEAWKISSAQRAVQPKIKLRDEAEATAGVEGAGKKTNNGEWIVSARLARQAGQPYWLVENGEGQRFALSAIDGTLHKITAAEAMQIAANWVASSAEVEGESPLAAQVKYLDSGPQDSSVRNYEALRPFHRFAIGDNGRELLISARTGEVIRDSTAFARALYWTGNWIHLLRPVETLGSAAARHTVQAWSGFIAAGASLTGLIIGWQRWRPGWAGRRTYSEGRVHPYRDVWNTWHFWVGLIGGTAALLWALSGYLSTNPWKIFSPADPGKQQLLRYQGGNAPSSMLNWNPVALEPTPEQTEIVELAWQYLGDQAVLLGVTRSGEKIPQRIAGTVAGFGDTTLLAAAERLARDVPIREHVLQSEYDSYYYPRHHQGSVEKPLPVLRVDLADKAGTRLYLDPQTGRLLLKQDASRRVYRWLYSALHHWDFGWVYLRPVWDVWMLPLVLMGVVLGGTSVVLGWKRLQIEFKPKKKKKRAAVAKPARAPQAVVPVEPGGAELSPNLQQQ
jgi:uncharacterized iron-regulated membrane protein